MRKGALLVAVCLVLAGCTGPMAGTTDGGDATPAAGTPTGVADTGNVTNATADIVHTERPDPDSDRLGWESGYWHDDPVNVTIDDGLTASERERVVARAMARVEQIRRLEFEQSVDVTVRSRQNFSSGGAGGLSPDFRRFDNAKFEAMFLIGTRNSSLEQQEETRDQSVGGYYRSGQNDIVIISSAGQPAFRGEGTLAHELVHALQDQHFDLSTSTVVTRDGYNGRKGLIEGDARRVQLAYKDRCGTTWACIGPQSETDQSTDESGGERQSDSESSGEQSGLHLGVYVLQYFPYAEGPGFVDALRDQGEWAAVNDAYDDPPTTSKTVIEPSLYREFEPRNVTLTDRTSGGWERVRPPSRADYATLGQSGLTAMFAYTLYDDYNRRGVVDPNAFLNFEEGTRRLNWSDPFDYALPPVEGWTGDRMHVYHRGNRTGYVWRLTWATEADAREFVERYELLLDHWGGTRQGGGVWTITADSPFTSAVHVSRTGDTVTIVNAPTVDALDGVYGGVG